MSLEDAEPSPIPIPFTKSDPIFMALKGDDKNDDANAKIRAQIDALKKQDAKLDEQMAKMKNEKVFDQAMNGINQQLTALGKDPVQPQNPFASSMPKPVAAGASVASASPNVARSPAPTTNLASVGKSGGVGKV